MIDLEKEREAFEDQWKKNGYFHFNLERKNGEERYSHRHVNFSFKFWCQRAELAQEETNKVESMNHHLAEINSDLDRSISIMKTEITKLKQKLEKLESGEWISVKDRTPKLSDCILQGEAFLAWDGREIRRVPFRMYRENSDITDWMPMPKPPKPTNLIDSFIADGGFDRVMGCKNGE